MYQLAPALCFPTSRTWVEAAVVQVKGTQASVLCYWVGIFIHTFFQQIKD